MAGSQLFCPFRAVGFFCNHVPLDTQVAGETSHVVTAVGNTFHLYNVSDRVGCKWSGVLFAVYS